MAPLTRQMSRRMSPEAMMVGGARVRPTARSVVGPAVPTEVHWLALSNLDRVVNPAFSSAILFYEKIVDISKAAHFKEITNSLKVSLAKALVHFYPLAGRLALREDGLVDLHCNDEGAIFIEAHVDAELSAIGGPQPMPALSGLEIAGLGPGPKYIPDQLSTMPTLVVQVTRFRCGSVAIAVNWHHSVADGSSGCHFIKSWAEMASGNEISLLPNHDRWLLNPREVPDDSLVNGYSTKDIEEYFPRDIDNCLPTEPAVLTSFNVGKASVQGLKEKLSLEDDEGRQFTSAECLSAHLWRQMTKARAERKPQKSESQAEHNDSSKTRFFMFVDGRKRLNLPAGYFGNVVCSACAVASEEDILTKPAAYAATLIRNAVRNITTEYFKSLIDWVEIQGTAPAKSEHVNSLGHDCAATFWSFFPMYTMDFGWGKPTLAARNSPPRPLIDGIAMMPSPEGPGNMVALINLHADRLQRLRKQDSFKSVFCPCT